MTLASTAGIILFGAVFSFGHPFAQAAAPLATVVMTTGSVSEREGAVGLIDAVAFIRNPANKDDVIKILAKGMRLARVEDAEEGYQSMVGLYEKKLYPSVQGIPNVIRLLGTTNEKIRRLKAEDLVDDSVVKKLEKDGRF